MTLLDRDEYLHPVPSPLPDNWQENLFFILWNTDTLDGFMMHVQRVPGRSVQEARIVASVRGEFSSATLTGPFEPDRTVAGVSIGIRKPFRDLTLRAEFLGADGPGPMGFIAARPTGDTPVLVDVRLRSNLEPVDFAPGLAALTARLRSESNAPQMGDQAHYEQGGTWSGTIRVGNRRVSTGGLFVRDHSWGIRHEHNNFRAFWTATCLDDGSVFCNAIGMPVGDGFVGIAGISDASGVRFTEEVGARFTPEPGRCSYEEVQVSYGNGIDMVVRGEVQQHWPMYLPYSGRNRYDNNAMARVESNGMRGFAVMEWATTMEESDTRVLDSLNP